MDSMCETCDAALDAGLHSIGHEGASDGELRAALNGEHPPVEEHDCIDGTHINGAGGFGNSWARLFDVTCACLCQQEEE
jgi:hypothetical protein